MSLVKFFLHHYWIFFSFRQATYRRGRLIGKGGFAKVYEVTELVTNKCFADKVINREVFARRSTSKDKVKREIMLHKDLIHPNVVGFCHFFSDDRSNVHIILEYCAMKSLLVSFCS